MGIITWLIVLILGLCLAALGVANRGDVLINLDPAPFQIEIPLFALAGAAVFLGFLWGYIASWLNNGKYRRAARVRAHTIEITERELKIAKDRLGKAQARVAELEKQAAAKESNVPALSTGGSDKPALPKPTKAA